MTASKTITVAGIVLVSRGYNLYYRLYALHDGSMDGLQIRLGNRGDGQWHVTALIRVKHLPSVQLFEVRRSSVAAVIPVAEKRLRAIKRALEGIR